MNAEVFLRAARELDNDRFSGGCCFAIDCALGYRTYYQSEYHVFFESLFPWSGKHPQEIRISFGCLTKKNRKTRVLALLFCYHAAKALS